MSVVVAGDGKLNRSQRRVQTTTCVTAGEESCASVFLTAESSSLTSGTTTGTSGRASVAREPRCRRQRTLSLLHQSFWPPPKLLSGRFEIAAASCCYSDKKLCFESPTAVYAAAKMCGPVL
ncbi:uncharacterized protein DS421_2g50750 [Arachis hypogaea]|nr:uncharacterized protein DS421_2g50750 [Arachis hypogaea]